MTPDIKKAIIKRQRAWASGDVDKYKFLRNKVMKLCKVARGRYYQNCVSNLKESNSKKWWNTIKPMSGFAKPAAFSSMSLNGSLLKGTDLAEAINNSFCNIADEIPPLTYIPVPVSQVPEEYTITPEEVEKALRSIKICKSVGLDEIPNWILKNGAHLLNRPICQIFNSSIIRGHVPSLWKCADVTPIPKVSKRESIENDLRPISLTAVLSKLLEGFVFKWLSQIVLPQLHPCQFGGIKDSSATHLLVRLIHEWLLATESPKTFVRSCLVDFSKAFDRIDRNILIGKLRDMNVPPILLKWCAEFLKSRFQRTEIGHAKSSWKVIHAGVPQGTRLGPLLFLVMVNDLSPVLPMYKFIDDCTSSEIVSLGQNSVMQNDVDYISEWTTTNNMRINVKKTKEFRVSFLKSEPQMEPLIINNQPIEVVKSTKLLGLNLRSDLKWSSHVEKICSKASKRLYALRTLKRSGVPAKDLRTIYCSFIRPVMEYACPVWHSSPTMELQKEIEHVQRRALRIIIPYMSYEDALSHLHLESLRDRRELLTKSFYRSVLKQDSKLNDLIPTVVNHTYSLRNPRNIPMFKSRTNRFKNSTIPHSVQKWDTVP